MGGWGCWGPAESCFVQDGCLRGRWDCEGLLLSTGEMSGTWYFLGQVLTLCHGMGGTTGPLWDPQPWEGSLSSHMYSPGLWGSSSSSPLRQTLCCGQVSPFPIGTGHLSEKF